MKVLGNKRRNRSRGLGGTWSGRGVGVAGFRGVKDLETCGVVFVVCATVGFEYYKNVRTDTDVPLCDNCIPMAK